jgi:hypothetical protein
MKALDQLKALRVPLEELQQQATEIVKKEVEAACLRRGYIEFHLHYSTFAITKTGKKVWNGEALKAINDLENEFHDLFGKDTPHLIYKGGKWL